MPRRPRLAIAGIPWHIIQRGNNRKDCFFSDEDYRFYLQTLQEQSQRYGCAIHAYVLMTNHVHLLLTPEVPEGPSLLMQHLGQRYVQYINKTYQRSGTLWDGRFRSCLTQDETYFLICHRYIELNPVRAGMVNGPADYLWSSYRANALGEAGNLLTHHYLYRRLGRNTEERLANYRALFEAKLEEETINNIRQATNGNYALGNEEFIRDVEWMLNRRARAGHPGRPGHENCNEQV